MDASCALRDSITFSVELRDMSNTKSLLHFAASVYSGSVRDHFTIDARFFSSRYSGQHGVIVPFKDTWIFMYS